jgi:hypothetical protein
MMQREAQHPTQKRDARKGSRLGKGHEHRTLRRISQSITALLQVKTRQIHSHPSPILLYNSFALAHHIHPENFPYSSAAVQHGVTRKATPTSPAGKNEFKCWSHNLSCKDDQPERAIERRNRQP